MQHNGWDHALKVTADGTGLVGHAGAVLLRKAADQAGLTAQLSGALRKKGSSPVFDRGTVLVSLAAAIALGATSMSDIALLAHLAPVFGDAPSGPTVRRTLDLAGTAATLDRIARARAKARAHVWDLIQDMPAGFPWLEIAGKTLAGWLVIDMDATLVTASSDKEGAAPTWKNSLNNQCELESSGIVAGQDACAGIGADVDKRQRGEARRSIQGRMPAFCGAYAAVRPATTCRKRHSGRGRDARPSPVSDLSCGDVP